MKKLFLKIIKRFLVTRLGLLILRQYVIYRIKKESLSSLASKKHASALLLLSPERFRIEEVNALFDQGRFNVLFFPKQLAHMLINICWDHRVSLATTLDPQGAADQFGLFSRNRSNSRKLYGALLPTVFARLKVKAVLGAAPHYPQDHDLGFASSSVGTPYVILMKECLITNKKHYERIVNFYSKMDRNVINHVIVYNRATKDAIADSGLCPKEEISVRGCIRMDKYLSDITSGASDAIAESNRKKRVVLFSFIHGVGLYGWVPGKPPEGGPGFFMLFEKVHRTFARLAIKRPEVDFVIKTKWPGEYPRDDIKKCFDAEGQSVSTLPNVMITAELDAQELILSADVVVSFGSTTMLEAAIAEKPVIVPDFAEAREEEYRDYIQLRETYEVYDVAKDEVQLGEFIEQRLENCHIPEETRKKRAEFFGEYISDLEGNATERYLRVIDDVIEQVSFSDEIKG